MYRYNHLTLVKFFLSRSAHNTMPKYNEFNFILLSIRLYIFWKLYHKRGNGIHTFHFCKILRKSVFILRWRETKVSISITNWERWGREPKEMTRRGRHDTKLQIRSPYRVTLTTARKIKLLLHHAFHM